MKKELYKEKRNLELKTGVAAALALRSHSIFF